MGAPYLPASPRPRARRGPCALQSRQLLPRCRYEGCVEVWEVVWGSVTAWDRVLLCVTLPAASI